MSFYWALVFIIGHGVTTENVEWVETDSGLRYQILNEGKYGGIAPKVNDECEVHYRGTLADGTEFDSSYKRGQPAKFSPARVIPGWKEALQLMTEGSKWKLHIPAELAYGDRKIGKIPPNSDLYFELELLQVNAEEPPTGFYGLLQTPVFSVFKVWHLLLIAGAIAWSVFNSFSGATKARAKHILVKTEKECLDLLKKIKDGQTFDELTTHSICPSRSRKGDLGSFTRGQMVKEFDAVVFDTKIAIGEVVGPVKTQFGYHLIVVLERPKENKKGK